MKSIFFLLLCCVISTSAFSQSKNAQTVMSNYAAFGRGDVPAILATLAPDCSWYHAGNPAILPFAGTFKGGDQIAQKFFATIPTVMQITEFTPVITKEEPGLVVANVHIKGQGIATGKTFENNVEMRWTFDNQGLVSKYEALFDPAALEAALTK